MTAFALAIVCVIAPPLPASPGIYPSLTPAAAGVAPTVGLSGSDHDSTGWAAPTAVGTASWYSAPIGQAAAGSELRHALGRYWRGTIVRVCHRLRCTRVRLTDWCGCPGPRIIDLPPINFRRLAPLWRGVIHVKVTEVLAS